MTTPVERRGDIWIKRDDLYETAGVRGGKVRTCFVLGFKEKQRNKDTLVTASARTSPQAVIVARIAELLGLKARCHMPTGADTLMMDLARSAGAEIIQHKAGYNTVITARAREDARINKAGLIPFGMECREAVYQTEKEVENLPRDIKRIVVTIGSAMSAAGILHGLNEFGFNDTKVLGVTVGADPTKRLDRYAPYGWRRQLTLKASGLRYDQPAPVTVVDDIELDAYYEAKCLPFLQPGDLFWIVGIRPSA
jgi:1-aminocyclopropane-1-carboxylate deaminase/D-cysteine desulfhydrase-like pyridoxal-dependent ACC family enzyme